MPAARTRIAAALLGVALTIGASSGHAAEPLTRIRLAFPSAADFADIPTLMAAERLRARGVVVEPLFFAQEALAVQAVTRGSADAGTGASRGIMAAMQQGARLQFFATQHRLLWTFYARKELTGCGDLQGKRLALHSHGGVSTALVRGWMREHCPSIAPQILIIPGSENRAAALLAQQIDATPLELSDALQVDQVRPGQFHRLADFSRAYPWLLESLFYAAPATLAGRRDAVQTVVVELIGVHRQIVRDPDLLGRIAPRYVRLVDPSALSVIARAHVEAELWPTDGAFTESSLSRTLQYFVDIESIRPGLRADQIGDYTFVREALGRLGSSW